MRQGIGSRAQCARRLVRRARCAADRAGHSVRRTGHLIWRAGELIRWFRGSIRLSELRSGRGEWCFVRPADRFGDLEHDCAGLDSRSAGLESGFGRRDECCGGGENRCAFLEALFRNLTVEMAGWKSKREAGKSLRRSCECPREVSARAVECPLRRTVEDSFKDVRTGRTVTGMARV